MGRDGTTSHRVLAVPAAAVVMVLSDPRTYDGVVVGSRRIRWFDARWPEVGSRFHHTVGMGPLSVRDHTEVIANELPDRLVLAVQVRPLGSAEVEFRITPEASATRVDITETPTSGLLAATWSPPLAVLTRRRNDTVLARLEKVARQRARTAALEGGGEARAVPGDRGRGPRARVGDVREVPGSPADRWQAGSHRFAVDRAVRLAIAREHEHVGGPVQVGEAFPADGPVNDDPLGHVRSRQPVRDPGAVAPVDVGATDEVEGRQVLGAAERARRGDPACPSNGLARCTASCRDRLSRLVMGTSDP